MNDKTSVEGGKGYQKLQQLQTIEEILATAMEFELTARDFYHDLIDKVSKPIRSLIQDLATEEANHYELFKELNAKEDIHQHIGEKIQTPTHDHRFSDYLKTPDLGEQPSDQDILLYALGREQAAMEQYSELAKQAPAGPIADLFQFLANEELEHKKELEKIYYEIVHNGGV